MGFRFVKREVRCEGEEKEREKLHFMTPNKYGNA